MSLHECLDCNNMVSNDATTCPHCASMKLPLYSGEKLVLQKHVTVTILICSLLVIAAYLVSSLSILVLVIGSIICYPLHFPLMKFLSRIW
jgi:hypothetical protein